MNRFTEKFKSVDFGPQKCPNYPNYKHNKYFPQKELHHFQMFMEHQTNLVGIYMFKVNYRNTRTRCEICSELIIKTPERRQ